MEKLPLNALRAFATVYACGGVRAAARELGVAHSAVSRHLAELEDWLGVPVISEDAHRRAVVFTAQGEALGKAMVAGFRDIERAIAALRESKSTRSVTISCAPSFAVRWLLPRLTRLEQSHPQLEVSVLVDQKIVDFDAGDVDVAIRMGVGPWPNLRCEPLMDDALYPVVSAKAFATVDRPWQPADLLGLKLLHDRDPHASWEAWRQAHGPSSLDVQAGPRFASTDLVLRAAMQGQGVALARHRLAADDLASGALVRPIAGLQVPLKDAYWMVLPAHGKIRHATQVLVTWLKEQAQRDQ
jgi:LysR family transcriptional regulator, glycine cleavage system transcriptional activator